MEALEEPSPRSPPEIMGGGDQPRLREAPTLLQRLA